MQNPMTDTVNWVAAMPESQAHQATTRENWMHPIRWIPPAATSLLDVGCNVGELLEYCHKLYPLMHLAGVEINRAALERARQRLPFTELYSSSAVEMPFADQSFDCITCIETLEHIPAQLRKQCLREIRRVLKPGGRFVLRVPHAGIFAFLDSNNLRFRLPSVYRRLLKKGRRDAGYARGSDDVVWHHHFTRDELFELLGDDWQLEASRTGGLLLLPLTDFLLWPFYRTQRTDNIFYRALHSLAEVDIGWDFGKASFDILFVLKKV
jgi:SAM-dependent methyltransferase